MPSPTSLGPRLAVACLAAFVWTAASWAEPAPGPAAAAPSPAETGPAAPALPGPAGANGVKALRAACRDEVRAQSITGPARRSAISDCVVRRRPDLAAREQCRTTGFDKGLRHDELHAYVRTCLHPQKAEPQAPSPGAQNPKG